MRAIKRILVPVDFGPCSHAAVGQAIVVGRRFGAEVDVLNVWKPLPAGVPTAPVKGPDGGPQSAWQHAQDEIAERMDEFLEEFEADGFGLKRLVVAGEPAQEILAAAEREGYDLIVMGTHGRAGLAQLLLGSLTYKIVRQAPCPVLTVRATATPKPDA